MSENICRVTRDARQSKLIYTTTNDFDSPKAKMLVLLTSTCQQTSMRQLSELDNESGLRSIRMISTAAALNCARLTKNYRLSTIIMLVPLSAFGAALIAAYWYIYSNTPSGIENTVVDTAVQYQTICQTIATNVSSQTGVHYPGSEFYTQNLYHFSASNTQQCACTVEPGSLEDVGKILQILGSTRTPFSVKSGGHSANPGFSSSEGVQIVMKRFDNIEYDPETQTVMFGTGLVFDEVYAALEPYNMTVAGARAAGIGVGGFLLGGGYSWKTNEYGLGFDYIIAYELVKPNGDVVKVTRESDPELFFGLKGGLNNFGIVTHFIMKVLPQHLVWGGTIVYPATSASDVTAAIAKFSATNTDPKGNIVASYVFGDKQFFIPVVFYYDGPSPPSGLFDDFMKIPSTVQNVHEETLTDFIRKVSLAISSGLRGGVHTVPLLEYTPHIMNVIQNETIFWGTTLQNKGITVMHIVEPFLSSILSHGSAPTAYPPSRDKAYSPLGVYFLWADPGLDSIACDAVRQSVARIREVLIDEGQDITHAALYPNYAMFDTPLRAMYGDNVDRLRALKKVVDPSNVMGLTGGFII